MNSRSQLEWAVLTLSGMDRGTSAIEGRSQLKRLWLADREMRYEGPRSEYPLRKNYAFFEGKMPGKGNAVSYTRHDAYMLCIAFKFLKLNWKPVTIIATCRTFRKALAVEYDRLIAAKGEYGLGLAEPNQQDVHRLEQGNFVQDQDRLSWLLATASLFSGLRYERDSENPDAPFKIANIVHSTADLSKISAELAMSDGHAIIFEICNPALSLDYLLDMAPVKKRGRRPKQAD